jgi:hypothetical protein
MLAFLNMVEKKGNGMPSTVVICADQWLFGNSFKEKRWLENREEALEMMQKTGVKSLSKIPSKGNMEKEWIKELFSVRYLIRSVMSRGKVEKFEVCQSIQPDKMMFLPDGSRSIPQRVLNASEKEISERAHDYFNSSKDEYFTQLDTFQCILFEHIINYLDDHHCNVLLFIPPFHPETISLYEQSNQTSGIFKAESYLQTFAKTHHLKLIGDNHSEDMSLSIADFYDGVHLKPKSLNMYFQTKGKISELIQ